MSFYQKSGKRSIDIIFSLLGLLFLWPFFLLVALLIKLDSPGPVIFKQKRVGKNGKIFTFYKFRTMIKDAERLKEKYHHLNEADGPVFKIKNDPRYTKIGKILSHTGLDELPQLVNILKGEMSFIGPRPLPIKEEEKIEPKYRFKRQSVLPGLISSWIIMGGHRLSFSRWMEFDLKDINNQNFIYGMEIFGKTISLAIGLLFKQFKRYQSS